MRRSEPVAPRPRREPEPELAREIVHARVEVEHATAAGEALDALAAAVFSGAVGRARVAPLLEHFDTQVGALEPDEPELELLQVSRMDWALCDVPATPDAAPGDTWAWRAIHGQIGGVAKLAASAAVAARSIVGLFEVYPGQPTWVRDRVSGVVLRLLDGVGPLSPSEPGQPAALWELRLVPDPSGGFLIARIPIDYPLELIEDLDEQLARRFSSEGWPSMLDLRRARLRYLRAGKRTPIGRMLRWR